MHQNFLTAVKRVLPVILANVAAALPVVILFLFYAAPRFEERYLQDRRESTRIAVETVSALLAAQQGRVEKGEITLEAAQTETFELVKALRYNTDDYFWIQNANGKMLMHPIKPELNNQDLLGIKDHNGKAFFYELMETSNRGGNAMVDYFWPKPGKDTPVAKTSYAKLFKPWGWAVGSGVYIDDVQADLALFKSRLNALLAVCVALSLLIAVGSGLRYARTTLRSVERVAHRLMSEAGRLSSAASQINTASQQLAQSTTEQSAAIEETVTSMEEIGSMIAQSSQNARDTMQQADHGQIEAAQGKDVVGNMVNAMGDISQANDKLKSLVQLIEEIKSKTKVINDIAFETRLLSFNASIEAARAGANGRGFAVVAEEVGKLAITSSKSADEVRKLLESSAIEVGQIVDETRTKVKAGQQTSTDCERAFTAMKGTLENIAQSVQMIATATREQEAGVKQTNTAMNEMERVTQGNSTQAETLAAHAKELLSAAAEVSKTAESMLAQVGGRGTPGSSSQGDEDVTPAGRTPHREAKEVSPQAHGAGSDQAPDGLIPATAKGGGATASVGRSDSRWRSAA